MKKETKKAAGGKKPLMFEMEEGRAYKGSIKVLRDKNGRQILVSHVYRPSAKQIQLPSSTTVHGRLIETKEKVKFYFEFNRFETEIADDLMDEASELADYYLAVIKK